MLIGPERAGLLRFQANSREAGFSEGDYGLILVCHGGSGDHLGMHNKSLWGGAHRMKRVTGYQSEGRTLSAIQNLDGTGKNDAERNNPISKGAGQGGIPNLVSYVDLSQGAKESSAMACKTHIPGGTGNSRARDMPNG
jgi:hypothetical protein